MHPLSGARAPSTPRSGNEHRYPSLVLGIRRPEAKLQFGFLNLLQLDYVRQYVQRRPYEHDRNRMEDKTDPEQAREHSGHHRVSHPDVRSRNNQLPWRIERNGRTLRPPEMQNAPSAERRPQHKQHHPYARSQAPRQHLWDGQHSVREETQYNHGSQSEGEYQQADRRQKLPLPLGSCSNRMENLEQAHDPNSQSNALLRTRRHKARRDHAASS